MRKRAKSLMQNKKIQSKDPSVAVAEHSPMMAQYLWVNLFLEFFIGNHFNFRN